MAESIGNLASGQLLALLAIPLIGTVLLVVFIVVSMSRRREKSPMKHGTQPQKVPKVNQTVPDDGPALDTSILSKPAPATDPLADLNTEILSGKTAAQTVPPDLPLSEEQQTPTSADPLPDQTKQQTLAADVPRQPVEKINLADRLDTPSQVPAAPTADSGELLRLLRHSDTGQLVVEVGGQQYTKLTDVTDKQVGQYILKLAAHLLSFTNGMIETGAGLKSVYNPRVGPLPAPIASPSSLSSTAAQPGPAHIEPSSTFSPSAEIDAALLASLTAQSTPLEQPQPRRGLFGRRTRTGPPSILPSLNLADEINRIVQARLLASPLAASTKIEITDDLSGGIRINVNGILYASPDEVPDTEARELIKVSIKQWERS